MNTVYAAICYGKDENEAYQNGLKIFEAMLISRWQGDGYLDFYFPFDGKEQTEFPELGNYYNRYHHERWEPVIEGNSEKAKEMFDFLRIVEEKKEEGKGKDGKWWSCRREETEKWIESNKLWADVLFIQADNEYGYEKTSVDEALKEVNGKRFYIVAVDIHL